MEFLILDPQLLDFAAMFGAFGGLFNRKKTINQTTVEGDKYYDNSTNTSITDNSINQEDNSVTDNSIFQNDESITEIDNSITQVDNSVTDHSIVQVDNSVNDNSIVQVDNSVSTVTTYKTDHGAINAGREAIENALAFGSESLSLNAEIAERAQQFGIGAIGNSLEFAARVGRDTQTFAENLTGATQESFAESTQKAQSAFASAASGQATDVVKMVLYGAVAIAGIIMLPKVFN